MKKLLYIGHTYHKKTKSADFILQLLSKKYEIKTIYFDPYNDDMNDVFSVLRNESFDVLLLWQIMPSLEKLRKITSWRQSVFFPMYDGAPDRDDKIWLEYKDTQIISFCKVLHEELEQIGFSSHYIQYFPKPMEVKNMGKTDSVFFWQRINEINTELVSKLLGNTKITHLHFHKAIDPGHEINLPNVDCKITTSEWFDTKEQLFEVMQNSSLYIAPRLYEGIGMSFLDAMAMGRCVIAPNNPTMNEYIDDGKTGILYDYNNFEPLNIKQIGQIQKNTLKYIQNGYDKWEKEKYKILEWIETAAMSDVAKIEKYYSEKYAVKTYKILSFLPLITIKKTPRKDKYYMFGFVLIFKKRKK